MNIPVLYCKKRNARRYILRVDAEGMVRVTIPRGGSLDYAKAFAGRQAGWVEQQLKKLQERTQSHDSEKEILFRGEMVPLVIESLNCARFGDQAIPMIEGAD